MRLRKKILTTFLAFFVFLASVYINFFVWPFTSANPNYSDVEKSFSEIKIPSGWEVSDITENKGVAGRRCPIEGSGCFSKRAVIKFSDTVDATVFTRFLSDNNCTNIQVSDSSSKTTKMQTYYCVLSNGLKLGSDFKVDEREASYTVFTY